MYKIICKDEVYNFESKENAINFFLTAYSLMDPMSNEASVYLKIIRLINEDKKFIDTEML